MKKSRILSIAIAVLLFGTTALLTWLYVRPTQDSYRIVCLGDSLIGNEREDTVVTDVMAEILGEQVFNGAFGGTCMSSSNVDNRSDYYEDSLSMCNLADAIVNQDFTRQCIDVTNNQFKVPYFDNAVMELAQVDFAKVEVLYIEHGTNDYNSGRPIDNKDDIYDRTTYGGALRYSIKTIRDKYPDIRIILVTPPYCRFETLDCYTLDYGYGNLEDYVNLELEIAEEYGIEVIDAFHDLGINATNSDDYQFDGLHLNAEGRQLFAKMLAEHLQ